MTYVSPHIQKLNKLGYPNFDSLFSNSFKATEYINTLNMVQNTEEGRSAADSTISWLESRIISGNMQYSNYLYRVIYQVIGESRRKSIYRRYSRNTKLDSVICAHPEYQKYKSNSNNQSTNHSYSSTPRSAEEELAIIEARRKESAEKFERRKQMLISINNYVSKLWLGIINYMSSYYKDAHKFSHVGFFYLVLFVVILILIKI